MLGAIDQALGGLNAGFGRLSQAAGRIGRDGADGDLAGNIVDLTRASQEIRVSLAVMRTANETIGTLLDIMA